MPPPPTTLQQRLRSLFLDELEENLAVLNRGLLALEAEGSATPPPGLLAEVFRAAHSLKGAAHSAGVSSVVAVSDRLEERLGGLRNGDVQLDRSTLKALFSDVDALTMEGQRLRAPEVTEAGTSLGVDLGGGAMREAGPAPALRLSTQKLDAVLDGVGQLRVSSERLDRLAFVTGSDDAADASARWRNARAVITAAAATTGDTALARAVTIVDQLREEGGARHDELARSVRSVARDLVRETRRVVDAAQHLRMQPFGQACEGFERAVRDLAHGAHKEVVFSIHGAELEIDRAVGSALHEPLLHLLRNAVDHGVEPPEVRRAAAKPPAGTVRLTARVRQSGVEVAVADDGAGIDVAALRRAAEQQRRVLPADDLDLVFAAGVSTAPRVTDISGRGVGLDAVRARVEQLGGAVEVTTEPGRGTRISLRVPLTLSTFRALLVSAGGETVALPTTGVKRLVRIPTAELRSLEGRSVAVLGVEAVPVVSLATVLEFEDGERPRDAGSVHGVVVASGTGESVLVVDSLFGEGEIVMKSVPERVAGFPGLLGATVLADGRPGLVVNPAACVRAGLAGPAPIAVAGSGERHAPRRVLLAEDTHTTRVLEQTILESAGYDVIVAADGSEAWKLLQEQGADLVVSDVNMPRMDGFALCETIRVSARFRELPVVLVTSMGSDDDRRRGLELGANAYIVKSAFDQGSLLAVIEQLL